MKGVAALAEVVEPGLRPDEAASALVEVRKVEGKNSEAPRSSSPRTSRIIQILENAAETQVFPGAVLLIARGNEVVARTAAGKRYIQGPGEAPAMTADTVFDVAGLTTAVVTTTLMMKLVQSGQLKLSEKVSRYLHGFGVLGKSSVTIGELLSHSSGLPSWKPYFQDLLKENAGARMGILTSRGARQYVFNAIHREELEFDSGSDQLYSDLGFILLGELIETLTGLSLERAAHKHVFAPLGLKSTSFVDLSLIRRRGLAPIIDIIAPTEACPWRRRMMWGEVHDDNAWAMGGIAGHSGLFTTANDLFLFTREMMAAYRGQSEFLGAEIVRQFWGGVPLRPEWSWRYGWDTPSELNGLRDSTLPPSSVGSTGFTGCSLWIIPERGIQVILLSNRVHPTRNNKKIRAFRSELHSAVVEAFS